MHPANPVAARAALCAGLLALSTACTKSSDTASGTTKDTTNGTAPVVAGGDVAPSSSVTAVGNTGAIGYVGTIQPIAMHHFTGNVQDAAAGRAVFLKYNCYGCHGGLAGGAMGPSLRDTTWKHGGSDAEILNTLHNGLAGGMPAWKGKIPEPQLKQLVVYIRSLRTPEEPTFFFSPADTTAPRTAFLVRSGAGTPVGNAPAGNAPMGNASGGQ